jgi:hypothetical protein
MKPDNQLKVENKLNPKYNQPKENLKVERERPKQEKPRRLWKKEAKKPVKT